MKRFTETSKWSDPWFRKLTPEFKLLWQWILDNCDNAGVIEPDLELASFQIGYSYPNDSLSNLGGRVIKIDGEKWFIPKFIFFQYGELSRDCKAHNPVFASIEKHGLNRHLNGYLKTINTPQEKEKEKERDNEKETEPTSRFKKPLIEEIKLAMSKAGAPESESFKFFNYYESNGWKVGRNPMKSWQHAVVNWVSNFKAKNFRQDRPVGGHF